MEGEDSIQADGIGCGTSPKSPEQGSALDLAPFCSFDTTMRFTRAGGYLSKPFSFGDYTYATNGHVAIRVPRREDVAENADAPNLTIQPLFAKADDFVMASLPSIDLSNVAVAKCATCRGRKSGVECPYCRGTGEHQCDCDHCEMDCDECHGEGIEYRDRSGEQVNCADCEGTGIAKDKRRVFFDHGLPLCAALLAKVLALPGPIEHGAENDGEPDKYQSSYVNHPPHHFRGDGWSAIVMPMRWTNPKPDDINLIPPPLPRHIDNSAAAPDAGRE